MIFSLIIPSIILSSILLIISHKYFKQKKIVDKINLRSSHNVLATRSGGIAIYLSLFLISSLTILLAIQSLVLQYLFR